LTQASERNRAGKTGTAQTHPNSLTPKPEPAAPKQPEPEDAPQVGGTEGEDPKDAGKRQRHDRRPAAPGRHWSSATPAAPGSDARRRAPQRPASRRRRRLKKRKGAYACGLRCGLRCGCRLRPPPQRAPDRPATSVRLIFNPSSRFFGISASRKSGWRKVRREKNQRP